MSMDREDKTSSILRQFKKKTKRIVNKNLFTEFFYLNKEREVIEFLYHEDDLIINQFLKKFLPKELSEFVELKIFNDEEEEIKSWYYNDENLVLIIEVNWGEGKQEISMEIDIENFNITIVSDKGFFAKTVDPILLNDYFVSFIGIQANAISQTFNNLKR